MKTTPFEEIHAVRMAKLTEAERDEYDAAYDAAGVALELATLFYNTRTEAGLTQAELAARMGTSQPVIARIERGGSTPTVDMLGRLARATGHRLQIGLADAS